jgi:hypothetical protein
MITTRAPWHVVRYFNDFYVQSDNGHTVADCTSLTQHTGQPPCPHGSLEPEANATLIAAAPDMVEALKSTLTLLYNMTSAQFELGADKPARDAILAALRKAGAL